MKKYILYGIKNAYRLTTIKNYNAYVQDARKIHYFDGFENIDQVLKYISEFFPIALNDIIIACN
jgi:hypothetical protein